MTFTSTRTRSTLALSLIATTLYLGCAKPSPHDAAPAAVAAQGPFSREAIVATMRRVADRQLARNAERGKQDPGWVRAALYPGILATYDVTGDWKYFEDTVRWAREEGRWAIPGAPSTQPAKGRRHADNQAIGWTYAELSRRLNEPARRADVEAVYNEITSNEVAGRVDWWWADALFMAPPTLARMSVVTGDPKYLSLMDRLFWDTVAFLYDTDEHLIYRDKNYFDKRVGGQKVFWSRGNGWTVAGLIRVIRDLPKDHPTRPRYVKMFREMCDRLATLQQPDGLWRSNLLMQSQFPNPETSGTSFFVFAMTAGINDGILERRKFEPIVRRGWLGLNNCVLPDGTLGYVQPIGGDPRPTTATATQEYAVGAFLLAGAEMIALGPPLPGTDAPPAPLIVPASQPATTKATSKPTTSTTLVPPKPNARAHCMFVPTRLDDFAWENDEIAFRVYGPALMKQDGPQSGIDIWLKRTPRLIQTKWYTRGDYHEDHGEGLDGYKVGSSRGCGGTAILRNEKLFIGANFTEYQIHEDGPDRVVFTLKYAPQDCDGVRVTEEKKITLEAGSQFNRIESTFTFEGPPIDVAVGLKIHPKATLLTPPGSETRFIASWEPVDGENNGNCGVAAIVPGDRPIKIVEKDGQLLAVTPAKSGAPVVYYAGGGWSKNGFPDSEAWLKHVKHTAERLP